MKASARPLRPTTMENAETQLVEMSPEVKKFQKLPPQDLPVDSEPPRTFAEMVKGRGDVPPTYHETSSFQPLAAGTTGVPELEEPPKAHEGVDGHMEVDVGGIKEQDPENKDLFFSSTKTTRQQQTAAKSDLPETVPEEEVPTPSKKTKAAKAKAKASAKAKAKALAKAKAKAGAKAKASAKKRPAAAAAPSDPVPKAKAKAKSRAAKRKTASGADQAEAQGQDPASQPAPPQPAEDPQEPSGEEPLMLQKKTFARRNRPSRADAAARFDGVKIIFNKHLRALVKCPSNYEVSWGSQIKVSNFGPENNGSRSKGSRGPVPILDRSSPVKLRPLFRSYGGTIVWRS